MQTIIYQQKEDLPLRSSAQERGNSPTALAVLWSFQNGDFQRFVLLLWYGVTRVQLWFSSSSSRSANYADKRMLFPPERLQ